MAFQYIIGFWIMGEMNHLQYSLLISVSVHALILWWVLTTVSFRDNRISPISVALLSDPPEISKDEGASPTRQSRQSVKRSQPANPGRLSPNSGKARAAAEPPKSSKLEPIESEPTSGGVPWGEESTLPSEGAVAGQAGVATAGQGVEEAAGRTGGVGAGFQSMESSLGGSTSAAKGPPSGRGEPPKMGSGGSSSTARKSSTPSEIDSFSGAEVPGYVIDAAGHRPADAGAIYPEVDKYVLYGADKRTPINVADTEVCIEGEFLRSKEATTISEIKTDYSKCKYLDFGDESVRVRCPPEAQTKRIHHNSYLSSPLTYSVRTCLEYDTSNCYLTTDQETEREMCRIDFEYEGIWAEGTKFFYRCAKSETRTYQQPLQYNVRWFMELYIEERGLRRREILHETRTVPQCV
jgi:hypothetical protein